MVVKGCWPVAALAIPILDSGWFYFFLNKKERKPKLFSSAPFPTSVICSFLHLLAIYTDFCFYRTSRS